MDPHKVSLALSCIGSFFSQETVGAVQLLTLLSLLLSQRVFGSFILPIPKEDQPG